MNTQIDLSKLCGRKISDEEATRIREVASNLELRDDDAIWQLLAAIEYQKTYYEKIPKRIENASDKLMENIKKSAEKEVEKSQAILAKSVVSHAKELSFSMKIEIILPLIVAGMIIHIAYGGVMLWTGYNVASKKYYKLATFLQFDIGSLLFGLLVSLGGLLLIIGGIFFFDKDKYYDDGRKYKDIIYFALSAGCFTLSYWIYCTIFNL